jgi:hypothetical protein
MFVSDQAMDVSRKNLGPVLALDWGDGQTHGMGPGSPDLIPCLGERRPWLIDAGLCRREN